MIQAQIKENYGKLLYASMLFTYNQQDAEDLTHDTITKALSKSDQWNGGDVYKWMVSIMRRINIDQHRCTMTWPPASRPDAQDSEEAFHARRKA